MRIITILILTIYCGSSSQADGNIDSTTPEIPSGISCNTEGCVGSYYGPEFTNGSDVAHQFSNEMANKVGAELKKLYRNGNYVKVDLPHIKMTTEDMDNKADVVFGLSIPFISVSDSCLATTAFDHRGGWGHKITEASVTNAFKTKTRLEYIEMTTPEGLQEFWIQWQHSDWQKGCSE